jgi:DNA invertase Pin-like site-specific DNA recombinase
MVAHRGRFVAYYRVSTDRQGRSGLGVEAQQAAVQERLNGGAWTLVGEFCEVESGRKAQRPQLLAALAACKKQKAKLVVAKLDRLTRNAKFLLTLIDSGVDVLFCDMPETPGALGRFLLTTMASAAELEAGLTSERTKAALAAAKRRGKKLGTYAQVLAAKNHAEAVTRATELEPVIRYMQSRGYNLLNMAAELNKRKVPTPRGGTWRAQTVKRVVQRLETKRRG